MFEVEVCNDFNGNIVLTTTNYEIHGLLSLDEVTDRYNRLYSFIKSRFNDKLGLCINDCLIDIEVNGKFIKVNCKDYNIVDLKCHEFMIYVFSDSIVCECKINGNSVIEFRL